MIGLLYSFCFSRMTSIHKWSNKEMKNLIIFIISTLTTKFTSWVHTTVAFSNYPRFVHNITSYREVELYFHFFNVFVIFANDKVNKVNSTGTFVAQIVPNFFVCIVANFIVVFHNNHLYI